MFPHHDWLDKEHGCSVDLTPDRTGDGKGDGYFGTPLTEHTITVYTTDIRCVLCVSVGVSTTSLLWYSHKG